MDIYQKAKELGVMISESDEFMTLRKAEEEIMKNQEAIDLLNEFNALRHDYAQAMSSSKDEASLAEMKELFFQKNDMITKNTFTKGYIDSKAKVDNIFKTVSEILLREVNGPEEEGGGGCSSEQGCSGCSCGC